MKQFAEDMKLLGKISATTDIIYRLEQERMKLVTKYNKRQKKGKGLELNI
jgi:hypothetical protein